MFRTKAKKVLLLPSAPPELCSLGHWYPIVHPKPPLGVSVPLSDTSSPCSPGLFLERRKGELLILTRSFSI